MEEFKVPDINNRPSNTNKKTQDASKTEFEISKRQNENKVQTTTQNIECPYNEPKWSQNPDPNLEYGFEVLKSGSIIEKIENLQSKPYWLFGRLTDHNDIVLAHPTISRFHAVLQYKSNKNNGDDDDDDDENETAPANRDNDSKFDEGWYIYDLGSTHGTFLNKMKIPPKTYFRVKVGHMIKLGGSTRSYILQGPEFDEEPESELSVTELKELRVKQAEDKAKEIEMQQMMREKEGISWGMAEDADEETDLTVNPYASTNNEELFLDDPKKTLRGFFEREGLELEYKADEMSAGTFICRVELPIDDAHGKPIIAEVCHKGKKKECVVQCALEACRILDRHGILRQSHHEPLKRKKPKNDSDEDDDFLDRTGDVERKRLRKISANQDVAFTYDDLIKKENDLLEKITAVEEGILRYQDIVKRSKESTEDQEDEDLDNFMKNLTEDSTVDKLEIRKLRVEQQRLKSEHQKLQKLIKIAKPTQLPPSLINSSSSSSSSSSSLTDSATVKKKLQLPLFGKRNQLRMNIIRTGIKNKPSMEKEMKSDEEENDEDDDIAECNEKSQKNTKHISNNESLNVQQKNAENTTEEKSLSEKLEKNIIKQNFTTIQDYEEAPPRRRIGPAAFIPKDLLEQIHHDQNTTSKNQKRQDDGEHALDECSFQNDSDQEELIKENPTSEISKQDIDEKTTDADTEAAYKKKQRRIRNRLNRGRENIDIDDSVELQDKAKYSGWLPPENQTGDGITSLNEKFGY